MNLIERLRSIVEASDPNGSITLSVSWLRQQIANEAETPKVQPVDIDLTVKQVAALFNRSTNTVTVWLERGDISGAYKLHGREWRIPVASITDFQRRQAQQHRDALSTTSGKGDTADMNAWRKHVK